MLVKHFFKDRTLIILLLMAFFVHLFSLNEIWVERYYSLGIYPYISFLSRGLLGWIPFSVGDILYFLAGSYLILVFINLLRKIRKREITKVFVINSIFRILRILLIVYLLFNILWGLNYNRLGISYQLELPVEKYSTEEVMQLTTLLHNRLNNAALRISKADRQALESNSTIHDLGKESYKEARRKWPFIAYRNPSIKTSLYTFAGHIFGFTGYYNPISGEAQLKSTVPRFLQPFIMNHEIAHQVGYAKENEANFVAFLTGQQSAQSAVQYATYFEAYLYAARDLRKRDSAMVKHLQTTLHPLVQEDLMELKKYLIKNENVIEPYISQFYDQFLKMNKQPKGRETYNEVVALLIAYMKKNGNSSI